MNPPYPVMYKNVYKYDDVKRSEHMAVRTTVGFYLWTHHLVEVTGADASAFLELIFPKNMSNLSVGRDRYTVMLDDEGTIIDDVIVMRMDQDVYWISTLFRAELVLWFECHKTDFDVAWNDITPQWEMYAIQGPLSREMVNRVVDASVDDQKHFEMRSNTIGDIDVYVNRAGFTGEEFGYELYLPKEQAPAIEEQLRVIAQELHGKEVTEFQVMAWTLPCEAGFYYMRDLRHTNPFEVGLDQGINWDKTFIGKEALLKIREAGPQREVVGFTVPEADIHIKGRQMGNEGECVYTENGECVGRCMKITYSYLHEVNVGTIICKKGSLKPGDTVFMHGHEALICESRFL